MTLEEERQRVLDLTNQFDPIDIFNMDKAAMFYAMPPGSSLAQTT